MFSRIYHGHSGLGRVLEGYCDFVHMGAGFAQVRGWPALGRAVTQ